jgi:putative transposase
VARHELGRAKTAAQKLGPNQTTARPDALAYSMFGASNQLGFVMRAIQLEFEFPKSKRRGGARAGAGRKRLPAGLRHTPHRSRPVHRAAHPVHVTLRAGLRSLRSQFVAPTVLRALRAVNRPGFRVVHHSIQANHVHLIVEAQSAELLSSGMRGLAVRLARRINRLLFRRGRLWVDRWHGVALTSPRQVRNALVYVLHNHLKHGAARGMAVDPLSSAVSFDGYVSPSPRSYHSVRAGPFVVAQTWLLRVGWKRHGLIRRSEAPAH